MTEVAVTIEDVVVFGYRPNFGTGGGGGGGHEYGEPNISRDAALEELEQTYPEICGQESTLENRIDAGFISDREGDSHTTGYVPTGGDSGVTIGVGVDLGQRNVADLQRLGLRQPMINTLTPYLGLQGNAARTYLASHPLTLTAGQVDVLNRATHTEIYSDLQRNYEASSSFRFFRLPAAAQTVLASVALQYGANLGVETPAFFSAMRQGRWQDAVNELRDFGDDYPTRRNLEADVLQDAIDNGEVPNHC